MVEPYAAAWAEANGLARTGAGPLWVALGDSTGQGIGAPRHDQGYVGGVLAWLTERSGRPWRVVNLSRSGARAADVLAGQLPALEELAAVARPDLVTLAVGANDMVRRTPLARLLPTLGLLIDALPAPAVVATLPQGLGQRRPLAVNQFIRDRAEAAGHRVADVWARTGPPWAGKFAADGFHPNEVGYRDWVDAFVAAVGEPPAPG